MKGATDWFAGELNKNFRVVVLSMLFVKVLK